MLDLLSFNFDSKTSSVQCYLESKLDKEEFVLQGSDDRESEALKKCIHDTLFIYQENRDDILKKEIAQIRYDLNDMWNLYIESEKSEYNKQSVEVNYYNKKKKKKQKNKKKKKKKKK